MLQNMLYSNPKYRLRFVLYGIMFVIGLLRRNSQSGPILSQDLTMEEHKTLKNCLKNH